MPNVGQIEKEAEEERKRRQTERALLDIEWLQLCKHFHLSKIHTSSFEPAMISGEQ